MTPYYDSGGITIYNADCRDVLLTLEAVDHLVSDPPYSAQSHALHDSGKRWAEQQDGLARAKLGFSCTDGGVSWREMTDEEQAEAERDLQQLFDRSARETIARLTQERDQLRVALNAVLRICSNATRNAQRVRAQEESQ